jgi:flagellum-specific ATP synthase
LRVQAAFVAMTIAEFFREQGRNVLVLMDSVTRVAMAQRQIGLALGEPPATRGYTPSVFALLPQLIERCGQNDQGSMTGFFSVLVEGDDLTEPVSDTMRGILDGHLWLSRELANRGHYPAIDVLESISRVMVDVVEEEQVQAARAIIRLVAVYRDIADMVNIGAYAAGANAEWDLAVRARSDIEAFLQQDIREPVRREEAARALQQLAAALRPSAGPVRAETRPGESPRPSGVGLERMMAGV